MLEGGIRLFKQKKWLSLALCVSMFASFLTSLAPAYAASEGQGTTAAEFTEQELKDNDYILYFVNAGDPTPATADGSDKLGLYSSVTEQVYGVDPVTSKAWGLVTTTSATSVSDASTKSGSLRYYNGTQVRDKALAYDFELPLGEYDVTFGFKNPWSGRSVNLLLEGNNVSGGDFAIGGDGAEKAVTYRKISVTDGKLNVRIQGPAAAALTNHNDPLVSYLIIRQNITVPLSDLDIQIAAAEAEAANTDYTPYSLAELNRVIQESKTLKQTLSSGSAEISEPAVQEQIVAAIAALKKAISELAVNEPYDSFTPGAVWRDTNGAVIQAHGAGMMYDEETQTYYWYGEDKTNGYLPARGVRVYVSKDLYNWEDKGLALTAIESADDFINDPLISELYEGRTDQADILNDIGTDRIIERPKVIYNDKTKKYVMWMHTDGPSATSTANYAKAEAGYALSDSPLGPFVYQESHRMDRAPAGATDDGQPNQPGMARDMTLFKDDDGTAYLVYSSEENLTIYISKLNDSYTDVVGWHKDGNEERDTEYKAVHGVDYVRVFPLAQREAPALFKYQGKYYMITSGATGWAPNVGKYTVADNIMGPWKAMRDVAPGSSTTFGSQSTQVIPVDAAAGKFIYMGDRWNQNDLANSRYVWLPIEFGQNDEIALRWHDEWSLDLLDSMGKVTVNTTLPASTTIGTAPTFPGTVNVTLSDGTSKDTPIAWSLNAAAFQKPGTVRIIGTLTELSNKKVEHQMYVIPEGSAYFVHAGGAETADYKDIIALMGEENVLNGETIDQKYDPANNQSWGYVGDNTLASGTSSGDIFTSLRYLKGNSGDDLSYRFDLDNGNYDVYVGLYDPWSQYSNGQRIADIILNGAVKTSGYVFTAASDVMSYGNVAVDDGKLELTVHRSANAGASSSDPQISWIMITESTGGVVDPPPSSESELIVHYDMSDVDGAAVKDKTGQHDGKWVNPENAEWLKSDTAGVISFTGGSTSSYIEMPQGILEGLTDVTVSALVNWNGKNGAEWLFALGQNDTHYLYMTPKYNADSTARVGIATNGWRNEASTKAPALQSGNWKLVTAVMSGTDGKLTLYIDGEVVSSSTAGGFTLDQIKKAAGASGYIGKSFYAGDPYFGGMVADFQIYDGALLASEVSGLMEVANLKAASLEGLLVEHAADQLDAANFLGDNASKDAVQTDLVLPAQGASGTTITWQSANEAVISSAGKVTRPASDAQNEDVVLTAVVTDGKSTAARTFAFTVLKQLDAGEAVAKDAAALMIYNVHDVRGNLTLPTAGENGTAITWTSEKPSVITATGEVKRPAHGSEDTAVKLTAAVAKNGVTLTKAFAANVKELPKDEAYAGYMFSYFTGEGTANGEQVYFALSEGNDPLHWQEMNEGKPVLNSGLGDKGVRDPFIIRSPEGDKFYLIATDLKMNGSGDWNAAQTNGSRSIMVWESHDLVNWSEQRMAEVSPKEAGNTWAPEIIYDDTTGEYVVFWASRLFEDENHIGSSYQRIMYAKTRDFYTFTEPEVYMDYGYSIIDTTMLQHAGKVYRFTKDERNNSAETPNGKFILQESGSSIFDPAFSVIKEGVGKGAISRGEGPTVFKSNTEEKWYMFIDEFGGRGYVPFETTDLDSGEWTLSASYELPASPRHGTVIPVTQSEYEQLLANVPAVEQPNTDIRVTGVTLDKQSIMLKQGEQAQLSAAVAPLDAANKAVLWSSTQEGVASVNGAGVITGVTEGTAAITATTADGGFIAVATVTVEKKAAPGGETTPTPTPTPSPTPSPSTEPQPSFSDTAGHWAAASINKLAEQSILGGFPDGSFKPDKQMSRAEFMAVMYRLLDLNTEEGDAGFEDISNAAWYSKYVKGLSEAGIVTGFEDGSFKPNQEMTREEAFVILYRALKERLVTPVDANKPVFTDEAGVSDWAKEAISALTESGFIKGYEDGTLRPKEKITRAEIAAIVASFMK